MPHTDGKTATSTGALDVSIQVHESQEPKKPSPEPELMDVRARRLVGVYITVLGSVLLATLTWAWSFASHVTTGTAPGGARPRAHFLGLTFTPTVEFSLLLIVILTAMLGSTAVMARTFALRSGYNTLERRFVWWYVIRPVYAAAVGVPFYMAVTAGFFDFTAADRPALIVAAAIGGLSGLYTDKVFNRMGEALALLPVHKPASGITEHDK